MFLSYERRLQPDLVALKSSPDMAFPFASMNQPVPVGNLIRLASEAESRNVSAL
jgi:hypothetical protein